MYKKIIAAGIATCSIAVIVLAGDVYAQTESNLKCEIVTVDATKPAPNTPEGGSVTLVEGGVEGGSSKAYRVCSKPAASSAKPPLPSCRTIGNPSDREALAQHYNLTNTYETNGGEENEPTQICPKPPAPPKPDPEDIPKYEELTPQQITALGCRGVSDEALKALSAGGVTDSVSNAVLGLGGKTPTAESDWCLYLQAVSKGKDVDIAHLNPKFGACLANYIKDLRSQGMSVTINSAYRSNADQQRIYADSGNGSKYLAARPGTSYHEWGLAADMTISPNKGLATFRTIAAKHGLRYLSGSFGARDPWHVQTDQSKGICGSKGDGKPDGSGPGAPGPGPAVTPGSPGGPVLPSGPGAPSPWQQLLGGLLQPQGGPNGGGSPLSNLISGLIGKIFGGTSSSTPPGTSSGGPDRPKIERFKAEPRTGEAPLRVAFSGKVTGVNLSSIVIDFGDETVSELQAIANDQNEGSNEENFIISHTYERAGGYRARLVWQPPCPVQRCVTTPEKQVVADIEIIATELDAAGSLVTVLVPTSPEDIARLSSTSPATATGTISFLGETYEVRIGSTFTPEGDRVEGITATTRVPSTIRAVGQAAKAFLDSLRETVTSYVRSWLSNLVN